MEITSAPPAVTNLATSASASASAHTTEKGEETATGVRRSKSKRLSKSNIMAGANGGNKERTEAYEGFWRKLIGIGGQKGDKGQGGEKGEKGKGRGEEGA